MGYQGVQRQDGEKNVEYLVEKFYQGICKQRKECYYFKVIVWEMKVVYWVIVIKIEVKIKEKKKGS